MPELPDVEGFRRVLERHAAGKRIEAVEVLDRSMLQGTTPQALERALKGNRFRKPARHGKWLVAPVGEVEVLMHFGMTGLLDWRPRGEQRHPHDRIVFVCTGGELRYRNMRRFGGVRLARGDRELVTGPLGPDAQDLDRDAFRELLGGRRGGVKAALMDQRLLAGLGNLMVDEILWRARVNPRAQVQRLSRKRVDRLYDGMRMVLRDSIPTGRVPPIEGWLTRARDDRDPICPRCHGRLRKATVAGRTACWCPRCQPR